MTGTKDPNGENVFNPDGTFSPPSTPLLPHIRDEGLQRLAEALSKAYIKYFHLFGVGPHGTVRQMMAMLEMCPEAKEYIRLYEKQRNETSTV
jgi:hypothetical protein